MNTDSYIKLENEGFVTIAVSVNFSLHIKTIEMPIISLGGLNRIKFLQILAGWK